MAEPLAHPAFSPTNVGLVQTKTVTLFEPPDALQLECGQALGPIQVAYETYGELNADRSNAVLVCHALTGNAHAAGYHTPHDRKPGWWDQMIGPGKGIDTNRYFVISSNILGGCSGTTGPSSINPATGKPYGLDFPVITVEDMVKVQYGLVRYLGVERLLSVIGGSMGGMQVLEWAVRYPDCVAAAIPIATTARLNAQSLAFDAIGRTAILSDADFNNGQYHEKGQPERGLSIARMIGHVTYLSEHGMHQKFGRELRHTEHYAYDFGSEFSVETYLDHQGRTFVERFDANCYLFITKAMDYFDLTRDRPLADALRHVRSRFLVMSFSSDWLFTPKQSRQIVDALLANEKDVSYCDINSPYGHDAFLLEPETLGRLIGAFLAATAGHLREHNRQRADVQTPPTRQRGRMDYERIERLIQPGTAVLDLGCGDGRLLAQLVDDKGVDAMGAELDQDALCACIDRGLTVVNFDLDRDLTSFKTQSWDYVLLSQTLQTLRDPAHVLREMLRIGRYGVVSFPNFTYWRSLSRLLATGRVPLDEEERDWAATSNLRVLTIRDFEQLCRAVGVRILQRIYINHDGRREVHVTPLLRAREAIFLIEKA